MRKKAVQQGRSEVHGAKYNERHACGRRRDGEPAVSWRRRVTFLPAHPEPAVTGSVPIAVRGTSEVHDATNKERHACERRRVGEAAVSCENAAGGLFPHPAKSIPHPRLP